MKDAQGSLISAGQAGAVMLFGGSNSPGSEHDIANKRNQGRGTKEFKKNNSPTFGNIKKAAKGDLMAALEHGKPGNRGKMTPEETEKLADCLIADAEKKLNKYRAKQRPAKKPMSDSDMCKWPGKCLPAGTMVLAVHAHSGSMFIDVREVTVGTVLWTQDGPRQVTYVDGCFGSIYELDIDGSLVRVGQGHRLRRSNGALIEVESVRPGHELTLAEGCGEVRAVRQLPAERLYWFCYREAGHSFVGDCQLWAETPDLGIAISTSRARILPWAQRGI